MFTLPFSVLLPVRSGDFSPFVSKASFFLSTAAIGFCPITAARAADDPSDPSRNNVTFGSPSKGASDSMPLGNGEVALSGWFEDDENSANPDLLILRARTESWEDNYWNSAAHHHRQRTLLLALEKPVPAGEPVNVRLTCRMGGEHVPGCISAAVLAGQYRSLRIPRVIDKSISGRKAEDLLKRFASDVDQHKPAFVTICVGINDVRHRLKQPHGENGLAAYEANVTRMVDAAQNAGINVILLSPALIEQDPNSEGNQRLAKYVAAMKEIAAGKKCHLVDLHGMFIAGLRTLPAVQERGWLSRDGVHMNPLGDTLMAAGTLRALGVPDEKFMDTEPLPHKGNTQQPSIQQPLRCHPQTKTTSRAADSRKEREQRRPFPVFRPSFPPAPTAMPKCRRRAGG